MTTPRPNARSGTRDRAPRRHAPLAAGLAIAALAWPCAARAATLAIGVLGGSVRPDPTLADYRWDVTSGAAWGAQALVSRGAVAAGVRTWRSATTQAMQTSGTGASPAVRQTRLELVGRVRVSSVWGFDLSATGSAGLLHLGYHPDQVAIDTGAGSPVMVALRPIDTAIFGGGLALERGVAPGWRVGAGVDFGTFALETAHRNGTSIENRTQRFGEWNARLELARHFRLR